MIGGSALYTERTDDGGWFDDAARAADFYMRRDDERTPIFDALAAEYERDAAWPLSFPTFRFSRHALVSAILVGVVVLLIVALFTKAA